MFPDFLLNFVMKYWGYLALLIPAAVLVYESVVIAGASEIALIERRWFGSKMPQGRVVALTKTASRPGH